MDDELHRRVADRSETFTQAYDVMSSAAATTADTFRDLAEAFRRMEQLEEWHAARNGRPTVFVIKEEPDFVWTTEQDVSPG